ncbi:MAG: hypothetical protein L0Y71_20905 [Gemmataceae bacterium]|nr:hypothetical protein [Gemmataceae bacterium]
MKQRIQLDELLAESRMPRSRRLALFAFVCLGVLDSLARGVIDSHGAVRLFFHADNGLFVRRQLRSKAADRIMSHGVQLSDLVDVLPPDKARRETAKEIEAMRDLCWKLLESKRLVA